MHLDLAAWLNLISTLAIVGALIFTGLQVRAANLARRDQAAIAIIQATQSEAWTHPLTEIQKLPAGARAADIQALGPDVERAILQIGVRLETIGYMVFRRLVTLETVDELIGGVTLVFWSRAKDWGERERNRTSNPKFFEWCEWLVNRIKERHVQGAHEPAYKLHENWRA